MGIERIGFWSRRMVCGWVLAASFLATLPAFADSAPKRPITIEDLFLADTFSNTALIRGGDRGACVRTWIDGDSKRERHSIWIADGFRQDAQPLEEGEPDGRDPVYSPDGRWLAFLSTRRRPAGWEQTLPAPPQSEAALDIWLVPPAGGAPIPLAGPQKPYGRVFGDPFYGRLAFSPEGNRLVFVAEDGNDPRTAAEIEAGVHVIRRDQGEGYTGFGPAQVWVAHLDPQPTGHAAARIDRMTRDDFWYGDPQWSPDGRTIVMHANRTEDQESVRYSINKNFDLWAVDVGTGQVEQLTSDPGPQVSPRFSPDGQRLACLSVPRKGPHADVYDLAIVELGPPPRFQVAVQFHRKGLDWRAMPAPGFPLPDDCWDGPGEIVYTAFVGTGGATMRADVQNGQVANVLLRLVAGGASRYLARRNTVDLCTPEGNRFLKGRLLSPSRVVRWDNGEGNQIEGVLTTPPESAARPPYKLILYPHGGPHSRSTDGFDWTVQVFAGQGYAVFQPNFRGSSGYGLDFLDADRGDLGGGDMRDILSGIDRLIADRLVDPEHQYVYGISYGGFMTSWLVGHTHRFRAAVAQNAVTDLGMMWSLSDLQSWTEWEFDGKPWEIPDAMRKYSPLTYATQVRTPTLILHSQADRRCPIAMGRAFHQALRARGVPTGLVEYPGEGHGIRQPLHRADVFRRTLAWFARHGQSPPGPVP